jgi:small nuclear ribonucleoprotein (snRNP)-like protein
LSSVADRRFMEELAALLQRPVTVFTSQGKSFAGTLVGVDTDTLSICLADARDETGMLIHRLFLSGQSVQLIQSVEKPFNLQALAERLERVFPNLVRVVQEAGVIVVMDRIRVTEKGLIEGSGPAAERVKKVFDEFMKETR